MKNSIKTLSILLLTLLAANVTYAVNYSFNNGTWTPSFATLTNNDSVTVVAGTWTLGTNTTVRGINLQAGTLGINSRTLTGRVSVSGNSTITATTGNITGTLAVASGTLTLGTNLTTTRTNLKGGNLALASFDLVGNFAVLSNGTLSATSNTASIGALSISSAATLTISGSSLSYGTLAMAGGSLNLGSFMLTAGGNITVTGNASITSSGTGFIDASGRTLTLNGGNLSIDNAEVIIDDLTFSSANDVNVINGGRLSFDNSGNHNISNASTTRHVNGTIRVYVDNSTTGANTYPLGNGSFYAPIRLQPNGSDSTGTTLSTIPGNGNYGVHYFDLTYVGSKHPVSNFDNTLVGASGSEYWIITRSSTKPAAIIGFFLNTTGTNYGQTAVGSTTNLATDLELARFNPPTNNWTVLAANVQSAANGGVPVLSTAAISMNTAFTFASTNARTNFLTPLPVSILDFSAKALESSIEVKWSTASEKNNALFVVEKSIDGQSWSAIGSLAGAQTSNVVNQYGLNDYKPVAGFQFYRLKQVDADGSVNYSKAIAVNFSKVSNLNVNIFPNPAQNTLNIQTDVHSSGEVHVQILNSMGELVYNQTLQAGLIQNIDITSFIPGVYYITVATESESKIVRLLKN